MPEPLIKNGWDIFLFTGPLVAMLLLGFLGLDEAISNSKRRAQRQERYTRWTTCVE